jgi:hypothetical protein
MKNHTGKCHICGNHAKLTYEHVPPAKAFNSHKAFVYLGKDVLGSDYVPWNLSDKKGKQHQKGIGDYTLCGKCNNNTGAWYADAFVDFTYKGYRESYNKSVSPNDWTKIAFQDIYPLRVFKEIIAMFFSVNSPDFADIHQDLRALVLSKGRRGIPPKRYGLYVYLLKGEVARYAGVTGIASLTEGHHRVLSELAAPPFGYVMEFDPKSKKDHCDITFFANDFDYSEKRTVNLKMPVYESNTAFPADYRTKQQILNDYIRNRLIELQQARNPGNP